MTDELTVYRYLTGRGVTLETAKDEHKPGVIVWAAPDDVSESDVVPLLRAHKANLYAYLVEIEERQAIAEESGASPDEALRCAVRCVDRRREFDRTSEMPRIDYRGDGELIRFASRQPGVRQVESFFLMHGGATMEVLAV